MDAAEFGVRVRRAAAGRYPVHASEQLAASAGVSLSTVMKLLGPRPPMPTPRTVAALARALEWDVTEALSWLGYEPMFDAPSAADRFKAMLRMWCRLPAPDQDVVMDVMAMLDSRRPARPGTGVTLLEAVPEVSSIDQRFAAPGHD